MSVDVRPKSLRKRVTRTIRVCRWILTALASVGLFVRPRVIGRENIPKQGAVIFASNHRSVFDPIALFGALKRRRDIAFMAKAELFKFWPARALLGWLGTIPVRRGTTAAVEASEAGVAVLRAGGAVAAFIEGKVSTTGELLRAKSGVAYMALETGADVVPVAMVGTENVKRPSWPWWRWGFMKRYVIVIGKPIPAPKLDHEPTKQDREAHTTLIMQDIAALITRANPELAAKW
jgi:1-acyl-sn-glycerol-3-phosphate acyltransferase